MGNIGGAISRNRQQSETKNTYNPDLEPTQQGYANAMYGPGALIGSYGMSGGQFPTVNKDPAGFGSGGYGYPGQYTTPGQVRAGSTGRPGQYISGGNTGLPGSGSLYGQPGAPDTGGSYQFGQPSAGYGGYSAMQPYGYQFGSGGAQGDINATGAAAYGGYGSLAGQYAQMGQQGVTPQERANLMAASNEAIQANLASQRDQMQNRAAQSGNTAGYYGSMARLGASAGQQLESADRANQIAILQENQRRKEAGLAGQMGAAQGQAGLYGTGTGYMSNLLAGRGRLASLQQRGYTQGAGTGGQVSYSGSMGSLGGG